MAADKAQFLLGACIFLWIVSVVLWTAAVASWAPFVSRSYATRTAVLLNSTVLNCTSTFHAIVWALRYDEPGSSVFMGAVNPYVFTGSANATASALERYPLGQALSVYGPVAPALGWFGPTTCAQLTTVLFPSNGGVYLDVEGAQASQSTWLGIWVAFFVLFCITTPACTVLLVMKLKPKWLVRRQQRHMIQNDADAEMN